MFIEASFNVETGEAERIAVDWTAKGGGVATTCKFHPLEVKHDETRVLKSGFCYSRVASTITESCCEDASRQDSRAGEVRDTGYIW
jgi:hypothetical protein